MGEDQANMKGTLTWIANHIHWEGSLWGAIADYGSVWRFDGSVQAFIGFDGFRGGLNGLTVWGLTVDHFLNILRRVFKFWKIKFITTENS